MKQTVVIKVSMDGRKARYKALKIAVGLLGVVSASFIEVTDQIEVKGEGIDAVELTKLLRKIVGPAYLISVAENMKKKEDGKKKNKPTLLQHVMTSYSYSYSYSYPAYSLYETGSASQPLDLFQGCSCC